MTGNVVGLQPLLQVAIRTHQGQNVTIEFVVDTGFVGFLALPPAAVAALGLPFIRSLAANLADDSSVMMDVHDATIVWGGAEREVEVLATGRRPLLGTLVLDAHELTVQFAEGGIVLVEPI